MVDVEREIAIRVAKAEIESYERALATAEETLARAHRNYKAIEADLSRAKSRHDRIADGGPIEDPSDG